MKKGVAYYLEVVETGLIVGNTVGLGCAIGTGCGTLLVGRYIVLVVYMRSLARV
jgi:hypothetical protein